ncbi:hypothetical protein GWK47_000546 [Chionoecetes opilio]|uniref:Uncharacterized protein n=1 Tax=Chionoecetes opilio TaxID=41210 RepID=A0A8J5CVU3_CHIOP|nr:hypothetical protein GWK47_000546 [Chionoecetes opilio]
MVFLKLWTNGSLMLLLPLIHLTMRVSTRPLTSFFSGWTNAFLMICCSLNLSLSMYLNILLRYKLRFFQRIHQTLRLTCVPQPLRPLHANISQLARPNSRLATYFFLINFTRDNKLAPKHLGPFRIIAKAGNKCTIRDVETHDDRNCAMTHLRMMSGTPPDPQPQILLPSSPSISYSPSPSSNFP